MSEDRCERGDEGLAGGWVAVRRLESALVNVGIPACEMIGARPTRRMNRRKSVPRLAGERRVEFHAPAVKDDRQKAMHVCEADVGNNSGNFTSVELARVGPIKPIYAMDDSGVGLGETVYEGLG
jgi:hypothetical protein